MDAFTDEIVVPQDRIAVVIGKKGVTKRDIEERTGVKLEVDTKSGEVRVTRFPEGDQLSAIAARNIVMAVACGFSPQKAFKLLSPNVYLEVLDLTEYAGSAKDLTRLKSRIIGRDGRVRTYISTRTGVDLVIGEKIVGVMGTPDGVNIAIEAIGMILRGSMHTAVFRFLDRHKIEG